MYQIWIEFYVLYTLVYDIYMYFTTKFYYKIYLIYILYIDICPDSKYFGLFLYLKYIKYISCSTFTKL